MIEIKVNQPVREEIPCMTISNAELIKGILAMPEKEYQEIMIGIMSIEKLDINRIMIIFACAGNILQNEILNPAQLNAVKGYIKDFKYGESIRKTKKSYF